jgi:hypothetical protein
LDQAGAIAQIDEDQSTQIPAPVNPPAQTHLLAKLVPRQRATPMSA